MALVRCPDCGRAERSPNLSRTCRECGAFCVAVALAVPAVASRNPRWVAALTGLLTVLFVSVFVMIYLLLTLAGGRRR